MRITIPPLINSKLGNRNTWKRGNFSTPTSIIIILSLVLPNLWWTVIALMLETLTFQIFMLAIQSLSTCLMKPNFHVSLSHQRSTTVSLDTRILLSSMSISVVLNRKQFAP